MHLFLDLLEGKTLTREDTGPTPGLEGVRSGVDGLLELLAGRLGDLGEHGLGRLWYGGWASGE
jgi:hypothetical protein